MKEVTANEIELLINEKKELNIIDVRDVSEVASGKIPGAINIPLHVLQARLPELDKSAEYIIVCHSGGRSFMASQYLESQGYRVVNMVGGCLPGREA